MTSAPSTTSTNGQAAAASTDPIEVVETFLQHLGDGDLEAAFGLLAEDIEWHNVPFPPARGKRTVTRQLSALSGPAWDFDVVVHNIAADGGTVLTERTDTLRAGPVCGDFWVCGTFEVRDGRITVWRDRFDFVDVTAGLVRGTARSLWRRLRS